MTIKISVLIYNYNPMNIEEMNSRISQGQVIRLDYNDTIRGGVNLSQLDKLRHYWAEHGFPSGTDIDNAKKKVRLKNG